MGFAIQEEPLPLAADADGSVRVGGTRVTLDTVVEAFNEGLTAEEIAQQYPVLALADIYAVISYYLRHREYVWEYLAQRKDLASEIRKKLDTGSSADFRERLLARKTG
jgi:uncharacterized protein (DUF433 family)